jgi:hypothetical protein
MAEGNNEKINSWIITARKMFEGVRKKLASALTAAREIATVVA